MTRIVVAGAGALGSVIGGLLARAGEEVILLAHGTHRTALEQAPLELELPNETLHVDVEVADRCEADIVILTAKRFDSVATLTGIDGIPRLAISLQNGAGKNAELAERFGASVVAGAATTIAAQVMRPGAVASRSLGVTYIGACSPTAEQLVQTLQGAGLRTMSVEDASATEWSKLAHVASTMVVQVLTGMPMHQIFLQQESDLLLRKLIVEVNTLAKAENSRLLDLEGLLPVATLAVSDEPEAVTILAERGAALERAGAIDVRTSMLNSVRARRRSELEEIHGELVRLARSHALEVPALEACFRLATLGAGR